MGIILHSNKSKIWVILYIIYFLFIPNLLFSGEDTAEIEAWEPEDIESFHTEEESEYIPLSTSIGISLIRFYQKKISVNSIHRCPFYISCSQYALEAIKRYGLFIGVLLFIDRNFYREHKYAAMYYPLRENEEFFLLLDDQFYLVPPRTQRKRNDGEQDFD